MKIYGKKGIPYMSDRRPFAKLTDYELSRLMGQQITSGGNRPKTGIDYLDNPTTLWKAPLTTSTSTANVETVFRVGADGRPEAVTRLVSSPSPQSVRNAGESDLAWLRRRVDEVCWSPS